MKFKLLKNKKLIIITVAIACVLTTGIAVAQRNDSPSTQANISTVTEQEASTTLKEEPGDTVSKPANNTQQDSEVSSPSSDSTPPTTTSNKNTTTNRTLSAEPTAEPETPVTVTSTEVVDLGGGNVDCHIIFSDGTEKSRAWKRHVVEGEVTNDYVYGGCTSIVGMLKSEV